MNDIRTKIAEALVKVTNRWVAPNFPADWKLREFAELDDREQRLNLDYADAALGVIGDAPPARPSLRFTRPIGLTLSQMTDSVRQSELYRAGDTVLVWVNEGDLWASNPMEFASEVPSDLTLTEVVANLRKIVAESGGLLPAMDDRSAASTAEPIAYTTPGQIEGLKAGGTSIAFGKRDEQWNVPIYTTPPAPAPDQGGVRALATTLDHWVEALRTPTIAEHSVGDLAMFNGRCITEDLADAAKELRALTVAQEAGAGDAWPTREQIADVIDQTVEITASVGSFEINGGTVADAILALSRNDRDSGGRDV